MSTVVDFPPDVTGKVVKEFLVSVSIPVGNGRREKNEAQITGTEEEAHDLIWDLLESLGVESSVEEI